MGPMAAPLSVGLGFAFFDKEADPLRLSWPYILPGTTSFIVGSHRKTLEELERTPWNPEEYVSAGARVKLGQAVLFDGRTVHRGEANNTDKMRPFLYMVFNRSWYIDRELAYLPNLYDDGTIPEKRDAPVKPEDAAPHKQILTERTWPAVSR